MKKYLAITLLITFASMSFIQCGNEKDFKFGIFSERDDGSPRVYIEEYNGTEKKLKIPSKFEGKYINEIWYEAFAGKGLTSVILPKKISDIGYKAFEGNALTSIKIPGRVMIDGYAFKGNNITRITIGSNVFLSLIEEPSFELGFDEYFFANNRRAGTYTYKNDKWNVKYNINDKDDYEFDIKRDGDEYEIFISKYKGSDTDIQVPEYFNGYSIYRIGKNAFAGMGLKSVIIPEKIYNIDEGAFANNELTNIIIPKLTYISDKAFANNKLTSITFKGYNAIYGSPFLGNNITEINVGLSVEIDNKETPAFELGFDEFFASNKERSGSYVYQNGSWKVTQ